MTSLADIVDRLGDTNAAALAGPTLGLVFGAAAQQSRFCLRSAAIELARGGFGVSAARWALAFSAALAVTQATIALGWLNVSNARQLAAVGSLSGAIIGGLMFGAGMILARGCASRLLVLSGTGNLRALVSGLILTMVAQASYRGVLAPVRETLAGLWTIDGSRRSLLAALDLGATAGAVFGMACLAVAYAIARQARLGLAGTLTSLIVGLTVAAGWNLTYAISQISFAPMKVTSISFTGPSADTLMGLINVRAIPLDFDVGLVPGVFAGAALAALLTREFKIEEFDGTLSMLRYIAGAALMGFGGMLAGGCAVGAGVSGGAIFALTSWLALAAMWLAAGVTDALVDRPNATVGASPRHDHASAATPAATRSSVAH